MKTLQIKLSVLIVILIITNSIASPQNKITFSDTASYKLFVREAPLGSISYSIHKNGDYQRKAVFNYAGQTVEMEMNITADENGNWKQMEIINPALGTINVTHEDNCAEYIFKEEKKCVSLPEDYTLYDDYGIAFETLMLKKYDMEKKGKQTFTRFRISEIPQIPKNIIEVEMEYVGEKTKTVQNNKITFLVFNWKFLGVTSEYWVDEDFKIYKINVPMQYSVSVREGYEELLDFKIDTTYVSEKKQTITIPMRDGTKLSTDIYYPEGKDQKYPIVLTRTPYKKEMHELDGRYWTKNGYIYAAQDVRGRFASEGEWEPFVNEAKDGYDTIEWLAKQEWSNGKIGMIGASYLGWAQLWAATQKPPHLVTIIPNVAPPDPFFNIPYEFGSFFMLGALWWAEAVESEATADISGKKMSQINERKYTDILKHLPVIDIDKKIFGVENKYWRKWIKHNVNDEYWAPANYLDKLKNVDIPIFFQSGWFDGDGIGTKLAYLKLKEIGKKNIKLIIGPWGHTDQATTFVGGHEVGEEAGIDLQKLYHRWFDYWLKGMDNKINEEPLVRLYTIKSKKWLKANTYPLPETQFMKYFLFSEKGANTLKGDGKLLQKSSDKGKKFDSYTYDPGDPTWMPMYRFKENGKKSYVKTTSERKDNLVYETEKLKQIITIAGPVSAVLFASSSARDTDWFVSLEVIEEDGEIIPLCKGTIRARFRNSMSKPELLEKNKIYEYTIDMWHTGITIEKGDKLRVEIASAYFPHFSRNLNTGGHNEMETKYKKAKQRIYHSKEYPSHILLPIVNLKNYEENECKEKSDPAENETKSENKKVTVPIEILDTYVGEYKFRPNFILNVTREGNDLYVTPTNQPKEYLTPLSEIKFHTEVGESDLTFIKNDKNLIEYILVERGGMLFHAKNLAFAEPEQKKERKAIKLNPEIYNDYVGKYRLNPNLILTITREGECLFSQMTGQPKVEVYPETETDFFYTVVDAQIKFVKEKNGKVIYLMIHQNGMDMQLNKMDK